MPGGIAKTTIHARVRCPYALFGQWFYGSPISDMPPFSNGPEQDDNGMRACCIMDCDRLQRSVYPMAERGPAAVMVVDGDTPAGGDDRRFGEGAVSFVGGHDKRGTTGKGGLTDHGV